MTAIKIPDVLGTGASGDITLPEEVVTQGFAVLARRRSGKSTLVGVIEEIFCKRGDPWVALDPASAHWGIRYTAGSNQRPAGPSGLNVLVVGGKMGDVPLDPHGGKLFAEILVETGISAVVDLKMSSQAERKRWISDFGTRLFEINETPRHVILEEAHEFVPQVPRWEDQKQVLGVLERLIKGGGGQGIGFTLISQRPASVSKDVLTQIDNLFVLRMSGPQDVAAVKEWFQHNVGDPAKLKDILDSLATMQPGDAWLLSPDWLGEMERIHVRQRVTYHAGRTPKRGEKPVRLASDKVTIASVVSTFTERLKDRKAEWAADQQSAADQRKRVRDLEAELAQVKRELTRKVQVNVPAKLDMREIEAMRQRDREQIEQVLVESGMTFLDLVGRASEVLKSAASVADRMVKLKPVRDLKFPKLPPSNTSTSTTSHTSHTPAQPKVLEMRDRAVSTNIDIRPAGDLDVGKTPLEMLRVLASWHPRWMTRAQLAAQVGIKKRGSSMRTYLTTLRTRGLIEERGEDLTVSEAAIDKLGHMPPAPRTTVEVVEMWKPKLGKTPALMLDVLIERHYTAGPVDRATLANAVGIEPAGSSMRTYLTTLRTAGLIVDGPGGAIAANKETLLL